MINVLTVENEFKPGFFNIVKSFFSKNEILLKTAYFSNIKINYIIVKQKKMSISWTKVKSFMNDDTQNIICKKSLVLPSTLGFSRSNDKPFNEVLCVNSAKYVIQHLNSIPEKLKITLYDPFCEYYHILEDIIMFSRHIKVITNNVNDYLKTINPLTDAYGVCIPISNKLSWISPCNILIAPKINSKFYVSSNTLTFTTENYTTSLNGIVFNNYKLNISSDISKLIPNEIPAESFVAALYNTKKFSKLNLIIPDYCLSNNKIIAINEIFKYVSLI